MSKSSLIREEVREMSKSSLIRGEVRVKNKNGGRGWVKVAW